MVTGFDEFLISLLHRMSNVEKLGLYFFNHRIRLNKFLFDILSIVLLDNQVNLPSNEYIQYTFRNLKSNKIMSCVDYYLEANE